MMQRVLWVCSISIVVHGMLMHGMDNQENQRVETYLMALLHENLVEYFCDDISSLKSMMRVIMCKSVDQTNLVQRSFLHRIGLHVTPQRGDLEDDISYVHAFLNKRKNTGR